MLVNGAGGIAVGMATNIPPHNLGEVIDACLAYIENPEITPDELIEIVPGPDFPTGALILGRNGIRAAYHTGRGSVVMRGRTHVEPAGKDREAIVVTEIPYQVNKARMLERIAELVRDKTIEGISDLRDESDREGLRVVIELRRDTIADVILAQLYRYSPLQTSFGVNMLGLEPRAARDDAAQERSLQPSWSSAKRSSPAGRSTNCAGPAIGPMSLPDYWWPSTISIR